MPYACSAASGRRNGKILMSPYRSPHLRKNAPVPQTEMAWAVNMQLMVGSDGKLSPQNHASRAEVAEIVKNYVNVLGK